MPADRPGDPREGIQVVFFEVLRLHTPHSRVHGLTEKIPENTGPEFKEETEVQGSRSEPLVHSDFVQMLIADLLRPGLSSERGLVFHRGRGPDCPARLLCLIQFCSRWP
jgi:hypothetical protein